MVVSAHGSVLESRFSGLLSGKNQSSLEAIPDTFTVHENATEHGKWLCAVLPAAAGECITISARKVPFQYATFIHDIGIGTVASIKKMSIGEQAKIKTHFQQQLVLVAAGGTF